MKKDFRREITKVHGRASANKGTEHIWLQRLMGSINVPILIFFIVLIVEIIGKEYEIVPPRFVHPVVDILMGLLTFSVSYPMKIGMQEIIED